jgi:hypothetical protein
MIPTFSRIRSSGIPDPSGTAILALRYISMVASQWYFFFRERSDVSYRSSSPVHRRDYSPSSRSERRGGGRRPSPTRSERGYYRNHSPDRSISGCFQASPYLRYISFVPYTSVPKNIPHPAARRGSGFRQGGIKNIKIL